MMGMNGAYIVGSGLISPQHTLPGDHFLDPVVPHSNSYMRCIEPVYRDYINPIAARRMSRLIKMGITAAKMAVSSSATISGSEVAGSLLDAIITGTGMGSVEDTEKIIGDMTSGATILNPTPFIQSTYNTISSQIAILLKCNGYNSTYVHRTLSFESALLDALLQIGDGSARFVLAGGVDEMTEVHLAITRRTGLWKSGPVNNLALKNDPRPGSVAGEGAAFFVLGAQPDDGSHARLIDTDILCDPVRQTDRADWIRRFLARNGLTPADISIYLTGINGDPRYDHQYISLSADLFPGKGIAWFKHLCGEYHTASGFALHLAARVIHQGAVPDVIMYEGKPVNNPSLILIHNQYQNTDHSLILVGSQ